LRFVITWKNETLRFAQDDFWIHFVKVFNYDASNQKFRTIIGEMNVIVKLFDSARILCYILAQLREMMTISITLITRPRRTSP
jgi:hypothetical protein